MPPADRTHSNERKLTKTILIVNTTLIITWLPDCILGIYFFLLHGGLVHSSYDQVIITVSDYVHYVTFVNGALNGLIYTIRLARIRTFYKTAIRNVFYRETASETIEDIRGHVNEAHLSLS